ncbi:MAG TPA: 50S ribosomal protein L21 [Anaerolineae bacterium]|nr:50S ribosomal protein L21 [Anaerolineae bacterium]
MYAVFQVGGRQYRATEGDRLQVERLPQAVGEKVEFDRVMLISDGEALSVGQPVLAGARVVAEVVEQSKGNKIIVFDYRPGGKRHRVKNGHRQNYTWLKVERIIPG